MDRASPRLMDRASPLLLDRPSPLLMDRPSPLLMVKPTPGLFSGIGPAIRLPEPLLSGSGPVVTVTESVVAWALVGATAPLVVVEFWPSTVYNTMVMLHDEGSRPPAIVAP